MDHQALMKKALMELKDMRSRLENIEYRQHEPIAIIGLGCRLPGGVTNPDSYWKMLENGTDAITEVPSDRWNINDYYSPDPDAPGKMYCRYGGFLDSIDTFDAHFFKISPKETVKIDPQHRILLEVTWDAFENASISSDAIYNSSTGVFVGISGFEYGALQFVAEDVNAYSGVGAGLCAAAGRLSYTFGLTGPSLSIDTACSSSLAAVHLAVQSLRRGECNMTVAAGVNLILIPAPNIIFSRARMLSPDGRCKTFDASADGYVRGEGCGVILLKRLSDALSDGDNVLALIRGSAVNQDGPSGGLTVPSGPAQERVIRAALLDGGVKPEEVSYVETHGTGTPLGDPIEVGALGAVFGTVKSKSEPLIIGTVKTNFGHLEAAAGVAGLIKVVLSMQHTAIPPHLHFKTPNPHIDWASLPIEVASNRRTWNGKKIAGVSSFGFSGTNAHVILEEAPVQNKSALELKAPLPTYQFDRKRYWIDVKPKSFSKEATHCLLGSRVLLATGEIVFESEFSFNYPYFVKQHRVFDQIVAPAALFIEMALAAAKFSVKSDTIAINNFNIIQPLIFLENDGRKIQTLVMPEDEFAFKIYSGLENPDRSVQWTLHVSGAISNTVHGDTESLTSVQERCVKECSVSDIYKHFSSQGLEYGSDFQAMQKLWTNDNEALAQITLSDTSSMDSSKYIIHPIAIDAVLQTAALLVNIEETFLPVGFTSLTIKPRTVTTKLWSHAKTILKTDSEIKLNFAVYTDDATPLMFVEGLTAKKADRTKLLHKTKHDDFLYDVQWEKKDALQSVEAAEQRGLWAIFSDKDGVGAKLSSVFKENGLETVLVKVGDAYRKLSDTNGYELNPLSAPDFEKLFSSIGNLNGVVYLWSAELTNHIDSTTQLPDIGVIGLLHTVQALVKHGSARLMAVTRGVWQVGNDGRNDVNPTQSPVWGFGRVLFVEHPELAAQLVDLPVESINNESLFLYKELFSASKQRQSAMREDGRYVSRLKRLKVDELSADSLSNTALKLIEYGSMDALKLKPVERKNPSENEVEIEVKAAGLNFRDVLNALGLLKQYSGNIGAQDVAFGFECCGVVSRTGSAVSDLKPGDAVIASPVSGTFSTYTTVNSDFVSMMPKNLTFAEAATVPLAYLTAWYALKECGKLKAGDRVLIHAAAGGVGLAAVNIAKMIGAEIYTTAGQGKWDFLKTQGITHIMDSRSLDFSDEIIALTQGSGVHVALNSLAGDYIPKTLRVLAKDGCFVEIGKIGIWTDDDIKAVRPDVSYHSFDMGEVSKRTPKVIKEMLELISNHLSSGALKPLINKVFPITEAVSAFRYMAAAKHIGKVVLEIGSDLPALIRSDATYVITGGLGALGLELAQWLVEIGAQHIVLTGRQKPKQEALETISRLESLSVSVMVLSADVSVKEDVERLFAQIEMTVPPVRGVFHAAGVLDDSVIINQSVKRFRKVMAPKVSGTWNLFKAMKSREIDFFVLFSSAASVLGSAGQSNYAAANAFLNSAANYISGCGIRTIAVAWGVLAGTGMAAQKSETNLTIEKSGINKIEIKTALSILEKLLYDKQHSNTCVLDINWHSYLHRLPKGAETEFLEHLNAEIISAYSTDVSSTSDEAAPDILKNLRDASVENREELLISYIKSAVNRVQGSDANTQISLDKPLMDQGFDSLMAVEFRNLIAQDLNIDLPVGFLFSYPSIKAISDNLKTELFEHDGLQKAERKPDSISLDYIDDLDDDDLERLIKDEFS